ncbi:BREX-1 system adenine-specific DNA-methyltransferase PglX [Clostridium haemolyticum]|uniref:site-specific DNA-methyltransferase (adenine-specific) n=1 Tax=Clostridium haemolyticum NCTC 9693 TaxID=1443114 RepID=A0ABR4TAT0_CLOHA|nr:BREX-1 system adenine-specific DNA-methyltransferase PglX [Clostridium haemolyticum]KEI14042.1 restriction endonuclease [Clostridium haemolyticum NCTC 9693]
MNKKNKQYAKISKKTLHNYLISHYNGLSNKEINKLEYIWFSKYNMIKYIEYNFKDVVNINMIKNFFDNIVFTYIKDEENTFRYSIVDKLLNLKITDDMQKEWEDPCIIGWLYQYYNSEAKDNVIQAKKKYTKEEIPFATQLFTPDWIIRYMVQNSLGRYWVESHPENNELKKEWEFYLKNPNPEPDFEEKLAPYINKELKVEDIKCFDPACGSGHILVYMFDVLYQIYEKCGYMNREIPRLIIENNLYGLDIDDRAYQLACFAVVMKGMKYNNRLLRSIEKEEIRINIASIQETNKLDNMDIEYIAGESSGENYDKVQAFIEQFRDAKIYGSLIKLKEFDKEFLEKRCDYISNIFIKKTIVEEDLRYKRITALLQDLLKQTNIMMNTYDILVTNPPYLKSKYMNSVLFNFAKENYDKTKSDLFTMFIDCCMQKVKRNGHLGFVVPFVWTILPSHKNIRKHIISNKNISSFIELEYNAFPEACVPVCTFTLRNYNVDLFGEYIKLSKFKKYSSQSIKTLEAINNPKANYRYKCKSSTFGLLPNYFMSGYWASEKILKLFKENKAEDYVNACTGIQTGDNRMFIRFWYEVNINKTNIINKNNCKWYRYNGGGKLRKWYGNYLKLVNWENDGQEIRNHKSSIISNENFHFKEGLTWKRIGTEIVLRYLPNGFLFDQSGDSLFAKDRDKLYYFLGYFNSKVGKYLYKIIAPTMNLTSGNIKRFPVITSNSSNINKKIDHLVKQNIDIAKTDWDFFETSWDFKLHPLLEFQENSIEESFNRWSEFTNKQFNQLKINEEELNRLFINIYNLQDEIASEIEERGITIRKADKERDIKSFISYAVGCMLGRYSLDQEGLVYAGGKFDSSKYKIFKVDEDNIVPILSDSYFEDDIVAKFVEFVKVTFGEESLSENLNFIAETLGKKSNETAKDTIRRYFLNDFFKDHVQLYKKRPIYWLFTSGGEKVFNCLIYIHRYDKTTLSRIRTDYLHNVKNKLEIKREFLSNIIHSDYGTKEKNNAKKKLRFIDKQIDELKQYDEVLQHMADMQIEMDLDDGVKVNYEKFKGLLSKI